MKVEETERCIGARSKIDKGKITIGEVNSYSRFSILMGLVTGVLNIPDIIDDSSVTWSTLLFLVALAF